MRPSATARVQRPDAHPMIETEAAHAGDEIEDRPRIETKLRDDLDGKPGRFRRRDLFPQRPVELIVADTRMALRIAGDADAADTAPAQHAIVDGIERAAERSIFAAVAGDDENIVDARFAVEPRQEFVERLFAGEITHRYVRYRLEAGRAHLFCGGQRFLCWPGGGRGAVE